MTYRHHIFGPLYVPQAAALLKCIVSYAQCKQLRSVILCIDLAVIIIQCNRCHTRTSAKCLSSNCAHILWNIDFRKGIAFIKRILPDAPCTFRDGYTCYIGISCKSTYICRDRFYPVLKCYRTQTQGSVQRASSV